MRQPPRRLCVTHFAFYRAYLEGPSSVDLGELSQRYLDLSADPLRVTKTIRWLQDELSIAARRIGDRRAARLIFHLICGVTMSEFNKILTKF